MGECFLPNSIQHWVILDLLIFDKLKIEEYERGDSVEYEFNLLGLDFNNDSINKNRKCKKAYREVEFSFGHVELEKPEVHLHENTQKVLESRDVQFKREIRARDVELSYLHRKDSWCAKRD